MRHAWIVGAIVLLIFSMIFLSTYPVSYSKDHISLNSQSPYPGWVELSVPNSIYLGQGAKVKARVRLTPLEENTTNTTLSSRFEINLGDVSPRGEVKVSLQTDKPVILTWKLKAYSPGIYQGTLWIFASGKGSEQLILAREVTIESRPFFFTRVENIRTASGFGMGVGVIFLVAGLLKERKKQ